MPRQKNKVKIVLGITGSFGSGKTTVAKFFKRYGAEVIDADKIAHDLLKPGSKVYKQVVSVFGRDILKKNNLIDRKKLGQIVFCNRKLILKLNWLVHPEVIRKIKKEIRQSGTKIIALDVPLLIEAGLKKNLHKLIVVKINRQQQLKRLRQRSLLKEREILKRIKMQMPLWQKVRIADFVIDNSGTFADTEKQARRIWLSIIRR